MSKIDLPHERIKANTVPAKEAIVKAYGKKRYDWVTDHRLGYLTSADGKSSWAVYLACTPFSKRRHRALTTNKAFERREGRIACQIEA